MNNLNELELTTINGGGASESFQVSASAYAAALVCACAGGPLIAVGLGVTASAVLGVNGFRKLELDNYV